MRVPASLRWAALALLGILVAAAVSVAASRLASQQIGLSSEPISAGDALAPARREHRPAAVPVRPGLGGHTKHTQSGEPPGAPETPIEPAPEPTAPPEITAPSHSNGDGEHGDGGADD